MQGIVNGAGVRIISFRKANKREVKKMKKPLTNKEGTVRELTKKDFKRMRPIKEVLPELANVSLAKKTVRRHAKNKSLIDALHKMRREDEKSG